MPSHHLHSMPAAVLLLAGSTLAQATSSISDYVTTGLSGDVTVDRNYWYGGTVNTTGAGDYSVAARNYSGARLRTAFGQMSGAVNADPPVPALDGNISAVQAGAEATGEFTDTFHFSSATLASGTPITLKLSVTLDGTVARSAVNEVLPYLPLVYAGWGPGPDYPLAALQTQDSGSQSGSALWSAYVGETFDLTGVLHLRTDGLESLASVQSTQTQDGSGSAHFYLDSLTPGVTVSADSGWNYASTVPEPSRTLLLIAGVGLLLLRRKGQAAQAA